MPEAKTVTQGVRREELIRNAIICSRDKYMLLGKLFLFSGVTIPWTQWFREQLYRLWRTVGQMKWCNPSVTQICLTLGFTAQCGEMQLNSSCLGCMFRTVVGCAGPAGEWFHYTPSLACRGQEGGKSTSCPEKEKRVQASSCLWNFGFQQEAHLLTP